MKSEYQTQKVQQEYWFSPQGVILGTRYLHTSRHTGESRNPQHLRKGPAATIALESGLEGCRSHCLGS
jgi:hypothetical protein